MKKKTIKLSSSDLESLVKRIVKENKGEQLSLEFPDYDERHPYLIEIEQRLQELNIESRINEILETVGDINLVHAIENIESELLSLETELQTLEKEVYDNEELPQEVTWGISDRVTSLLDIVYDLQEFYKDLNSLQDLYFRINENWSEQLKKFKG